MSNISKIATLSLLATFVTGMGCAKPVPPTEDVVAQDVEAPAEAAKAPAAFDGMPEVGTKAYCLVMDTEFEVAAGTQLSEYNGKTYVFCCPGCKTKFDADPESFINKS